MTGELTAPVCEHCTLKPPQVRGEGKPSSRIAFVGEAPGYHEIQEGRPFIGLAGKIIREVVRYIGIPEDQVYFTNVCLCRPPENRDPSAGEIKACWPRLESELLQLNPEMVVALGAVPSRVLFPGKTLKQDRGKFLTNILGQQGLLTYHPAAALYPKGDALFPFILQDVRKVWRKLSGGELAPEYTDPHTEVFIVENAAAMQAVIERLEAMEPTLLSFDWETTGLKPLRDVGVCIGISWKFGTAVTIPIMWVRGYREELKAAMDKHIVAGFNAALFDSLFSKRVGLSGRVDHDAQQLHFLLDERPQKRSLENLTVTLLDAPPYESEMLARYGCSKDTMLDQVPMQEIYTYCGRDADWALRLTDYLLEEIKRTPTVYTCYSGLVMPVSRVIASIQLNGLWVDRERLSRVTTSYEEKLDQLLHRLTEVTGDKDFNPRSHPQVHKLLWDDLELDEPEIYGRAPRSADKETLKALAEEYPGQPFIDALMDYRDAYTNYSRYLRGLPEHIDPDGRVRASYHMDRARTGRLSVTDPALHQIPRESEIRGVFGAPPGFALLQADYEQQEMRKAAHLANDKKLIALFLELETLGADFHTFMASKAFGVPLIQVTPAMRQAAKAVSFGILFRQTAKGLAANIGRTVKEAVQIIRDYEALMPDVVKFIERTEEQVTGQRYIETIFGRRKRFPLITPRNLAGLKREAANFPIQSASTDLTKTSLLRLYETFEQYYPEEVKLVYTDADSIITECPLPLLGEIGQIMLNTMEDVPFETDVPFPVELKVGTHWGEGSKCYS